MFGGTTEAPCPMTMVSQTKTWPFISLRNWKNGGVVLSWRMKRHRQTASPFLPGSAHSVARKHTWLHAPAALGEIRLNIGRTLGKTTRRISPREENTTAAARNGKMARHTLLICILWWRQRRRGLRKTARGYRNGLDQPTSLREPRVLAALRSPHHHTHKRT